MQCEEEESAPPLELSIRATCFQQQEESLINIRISASPFTGLNSIKNFNWNLGTGAMSQNLTVLGSHPNFNTCSWKEMVGLDGPGAQFRPLAQKCNKVMFGISWQFSYVSESAVS